VRRLVEQVKYWNSDLDLSSTCLALLNLQIQLNLTFAMVKGNFHENLAHFRLEPCFSVNLRW